jgi:hypothetical protein
VKVGDVLRVRTTLATPPKDKIALYVGTHFNNELFLWFNTKRQRRPAQMAVAPREAPGITHACFLDCGQAKTFTADELAGAQSFGRATPNFCRRVADEIAMRATTLTQRQRSSIAATLKAYPPG